MKKILPLCISLLLFLSVYSQPGGGDGCVRIIGVDPINNFITIANLTTTPADLSDFRLCSLFDYTNNLSSLTAPFGDVSNIPPDDIVILSWPLDDNAADLALYFPNGGFDDPNAMVDFMQYGSAGNGREDEAVAAGLWSAGDFIPQAVVYVWVGQCTDHSSANWNPTSIENLDQTTSMLIAPNPTNGNLQVGLTSSKNTNGFIRIWDSQGKLCNEDAVNIVSGENIYNLSIQHLVQGHYLMMLIADGITPKPIHLIKED